MKIAIADSSTDRIAFCKEAISRIDNCSVCWIASSSDEAIKKTSLNPPDMIMFGIDIAPGAVAEIMKQHPCIILLLTESLANYSNVIFELMGQGVADILVMDMKDSEAMFRTYEQLCTKVMMGFALLGGEKHNRLRKTDGMMRPNLSQKYPPLVVIGASTGGPAALAKLLDAFPDRLPFTTVLVQHVDDTFAFGLARWLSSRTGFTIKIADEGLCPVIGDIYIASPDNHLVINEMQQLSYTPHPIDMPYRPSIDIFFQSVAQYWPEPCIAVLLTGMGSDGAQGMKALQNKEWHTIAQHKDSCVVYGMPKAAVDLGAVKEILPIEDIGKRILELLNVRNT